MSGEWTMRRRNKCQEVGNEAASGPIIKFKSLLGKKKVKNPASISEVAINDWLVMNGKEKKLEIKILV